MRWRDLPAARWSGVRRDLWHDLHATCRGRVCRRTDPLWYGGLCLGGEPCDPITPDCGPEQTCELVGGSAVGSVAFTCGDAGDVTEGDSCEDVNCAEGLMCIENTCREMCDPTHDMCATGACTDVSATYYLPADQLGACL